MDPPSVEGIRTRRRGRNGGEGNRKAYGGLTDPTYNPDELPGPWSCFYDEREDAVARQADATFGTIADGTLRLTYYMLHAVVACVLHKPTPPADLLRRLATPAGMVDVGRILGTPASGPDTNAYISDIVHTAVRAAILVAILDDMLKKVKEHGEQLARTCDAPTPGAGQRSAFDVATSWLPDDASVTGAGTPWRMLQTSLFLHFFLKDSAEAGPRMVRWRNVHAFAVRADMHSITNLATRTIVDLGRACDALHLTGVPVGAVAVVRSSLTGVVAPSKTAAEQRLGRLLTSGLAGAPGQPVGVSSVDIVAEETRRLVAATDASAAREAASWPFRRAPNTRRNGGLAEDAFYARKRPEGTSRKRKRRGSSFGGSGGGGGGDGFLGGYGEGNPAKRKRRGSRRAERGAQFFGDGGGGGVGGGGGGGEGWTQPKVVPTGRQLTAAASVFTTTSKTLVDMTNNGLERTFLEFHPRLLQECIVSAYNVTVGSGTLDEAAKVLLLMKMYKLGRSAAETAAPLAALPAELLVPLGLTRRGPQPLDLQHVYIDLVGLLCSGGLAAVATAVIPSCTTTNDDGGDDNAGDVDAAEDVPGAAAAPAAAAPLPAARSSPLIAGVTHACTALQEAVLCFGGWGGDPVLVPSARHGTLKSVHAAHLSVAHIPALRRVVHRARGAGEWAGRGLEQLEKVLYFVVRLCVAVGELQAALTELETQVVRVAIGSARKFSSWAHAGGMVGRALNEVADLMHARAAATKVEQRGGGEGEDEGEGKAGGVAGGAGADLPVAGAWPGEFGAASIGRAPLPPKVGELDDACALTHRLVVELTAAQSFQQISTTASRSPVVVGPTVGLPLVVCSEKGVVWRSPDAPPALVRAVAEMDTLGCVHAVSTPYDAVQNLHDVALRNLHGPGGGGGSGVDGGGGRRCSSKRDPLHRPRPPPPPPPPTKKRVVKTERGAPPPAAAASAAAAAATGVRTASIHTLDAKQNKKHAATVMRPLAQTMQLATSTKIIAKAIARAVHELGGTDLGRTLGVTPPSENPAEVAAAAAAAAAATAAAEVAPLPAAAGVPPGAGARPCGEGDSDVDDFVAQIEAELAAGEAAAEREGMSVFSSFHSVWHEVRASHAAHGEDPLTTADAAYGLGGGCDLPHEGGEALPADPLGPVNFLHVTPMERLYATNGGVDDASVCPDGDLGISFGEDYGEYPLGSPQRDFFGSPQRDPFGSPQRGLFDDDYDF